MLAINIPLSTMYSDKSLHELVLEELAWEPSVTAAHIVVTAREGVVTLSGHVGSFAEKHAAEAATRRIKGVKAVAEEVEVHLPAAARRGDDDMTRAALFKLAWNSAIPAGAIKVRVDKGWLTLTGAVEWRFQADAAQSEVRGLPGLQGVTDDIRIEPLINAVNLSDDIIRALHRACPDPRSIRVTADAGRIRLTGVVHSWSERALAARAAWAAPGATAVENDLIIT